jgi:predicted 2-oxoglutarate/Fe(II)-dependent dioxygenase YbiX
MDSFYNPFVYQNLERTLDCWKSVNKLFSTSEAKEIIKKGEDCELGTGTVIYKNKLNSIIRRSNIAWLSSTEIKFAYDKVWNALCLLNKQHWGFEIDALQAAQYSVYGPFCHYFYHMDLGTGADTDARKLSVSINLSDPSEFIGGRLTVVGGSADGKYPPQDLGTMIAFPSYLLHRVRPVWWGTRRSLVFWATGKPFS